MTTTHIPAITQALQQAEAILRQTLGDTSYQIYLFGSRATGTPHIGSDIDLGIWATSDIRHALSKARFALEESSIPYKVDVVDLQQTTPDFQQNVLAEGILLWTN